MLGHARSGVTPVGSRAVKGCVRRDGVFAADPAAAAREGPRVNCVRCCVRWYVARSGEPPVVDIRGETFKMLCALEWEFSADDARRNDRQPRRTQSRALEAVCDVSVEQGWKRIAAKRRVGRAARSGGSPVEIRKVSAESADGDR